MFSVVSVLVLVAVLNRESTADDLSTAVELSTTWAELCTSRETYVADCSMSQRPMHKISPCEDSAWCSLSSRRLKATRSGDVRDIADFPNRLFLVEYVQLGAGFIVPA